MFKRQAFYAKQKIGVKAIYNITTCIDFTITSEIYFLGFLERPEFQIQFFFFFIPAMVKVALKKLSLPIYLWSLNFQQKSTRAKNPFYCSQLLLQVLVLLHLLLKFEMQICANTVIYSAVFLIISII